MALVGPSAKGALRSWEAALAGVWGLQDTLAGSWQVTGVAHDSPGMSAAALRGECV